MSIQSRLEKLERIRKVAVAPGCIVRPMGDDPDAFCRECPRGKGKTPEAWASCRSSARGNLYIFLPVEEAL